MYTYIYTCTAHLCAVFLFSVVIFLIKVNQSNKPLRRITPLFLIFSFPYSLTIFPFFGYYHHYCFDVGVHERSARVFPEKNSTVGFFLFVFHQKVYIYIYVYNMYFV